MSENLNLKTIDTVDSSPFKKLVMTIGELPSSFVESMTYYEALAWFVNYLQNTIIPAVNNNAEALVELQQAFITLKDYVDNYFDNLDVQEEINNKLDEMVEDGILQTLIANYLEVAQTVTFETVAEMIESNLIQNNYLINTLGFYTKNDGGGCSYMVTDTEPSSYYIPLQSSLYAIPINPNVKQLGARGSQETLTEMFGTLEEAQKFFPELTNEKMVLTVDTYVIQLSVDYFWNNTRIPLGAYYINDTIAVSHDKTKITGEGKLNTAIHYIVAESSEKFCITLKGYSRNELRGFELSGPYTASDDPNVTSSYVVRGIQISAGDGASSYNTFEDLRLTKFYYGFRFGANSWVNIFNDLQINRCYVGIHEAGDGPDYNDNEFKNLVIQICNEGIHLSGGRSQVLKNCDFEQNTLAFNKVNTGDFLMSNCYFEDYMRITSTDSALIQSCSFWAGETAATRTPFIRFHGSASTKITIQNCDFVSRNAGVANCAVKQYNDTTAVNPQTVKPTLIENYTLNMDLVDTTYRGTIINGNKVFNYAKDYVGYINTTNTAQKTLDDSLSIYRIAGGSGASTTITIPYNNPISFYNNITEYKFIFPNSINAGATSTITFAVQNSDNQQIYGTTTFTLDDLRGKCITLQYLGVMSSKESWNILNA